MAPVPEGIPDAVNLIAKFASKHGPQSAPEWPIHSGAKDCSSALADCRAVSNCKDRMQLDLLFSRASSGTLLAARPSLMDVICITVEVV